MNIEIDDAGGDDASLAVASFAAPYRRCCADADAEPPTVARSLKCTPRDEITAADLKSRCRSSGAGLRRRRSTHRGYRRWLHHLASRRQPASRVAARPSTPGARRTPRFDAKRAEVASTDRLAAGAGASRLARRAMRPKRQLEKADLRPGRPAARSQLCSRSGGQSSVAVHGFATAAARLRQTAAP